MSGRTPRSTGEVISTLMFAGVALWCAGEALINEGPWWRGALLWLSAAASLGGAFRFLIARLFRR